MRIFIFTVVGLISLATAARAATPTDEEKVVRAMFDAARDDHLEAFLNTVDLTRIAWDSHGQCTPETLVLIGKFLAQREITLETKRSGDIRAVRVIGPDKQIKYFFALGALSKTPERPKGGLVITAVKVRFPHDDE
jgi:hypothetical protein